MLTYQDLIACGDDESKRKDFVLLAIADHKASDAYRIASDALLYYKHMNPTIMKAQKMIYDLNGQAVPDAYSANNKIPCRYYFYFIAQEIGYLLGNGISFSEESTKEALGTDFDYVVQKAATDALNCGVSFLFWNMDHVEAFSIAGGDEPSFVPLYDEENGALRAGIRYWQIASEKPLRATLYEEDGITEYISRKASEVEIMAQKHDYIRIVERSEASGEQIYNGGNYPGFPIFPLFNINKQSELIGGKETLDAYDLMASALINNIDEGNLIYWVLKNCGGMDDIDDIKFVERLKTIHVAHAGDGDQGAGVEAHTVEAPFEANENALQRLRTQLFDDYMALDVKDISGGAATATQINAAYEPLNSKTDLFETQVTRTIKNILQFIGIDDSPTYTRSKVVNKEEEIQTVLQAATTLPHEYIFRKVLEILGDQDKADDLWDTYIADEIGNMRAEE